MAAKEEALEQIRLLAAQRVITKDELTAAYDAAVAQAPRAEDVRHAGISHILFYIGGAIVFFGITVLIWQHWARLDDATKVLATLGSGVASYLAGMLLGRHERYESASNAFYFISALVNPLGLHVAFQVNGIDPNTPAMQSVISGILLLTYLLSYWTYRKTLFTLFNVVMGTGLFFSFTNYLVWSHPVFDWRFSAYRVLATGLAYAFLGYALSDTRQRSLTGALYGFGAFLFLGAALALGDWKPHQNMWWELAFPGLTFGVMFLSVHLRSRAFLTFGSLYLMVYLGKITSEYFADSLGWPLTLVLTGLGLIAIGYVHVSLQRKYIA